MEEVADRTHAVTAGVHVTLRDVLLAVADGHVEEAVALLWRFMERAVESGALVRGRMFGVLTLLDPLLYLGREQAWLAAAAAERLREPSKRASVIVAPCRHGRGEARMVGARHMLSTRGRGTRPIARARLIIRTKCWRCRAEH
jgi:hypothetical protein